jgi:F-type H+-transporting ATPase subunit gamma
VAKARGIVKRRKAVQNIRKITRTMQLIATARFQRAFNRAMATRPYTEKLTELVRDVAATKEEIRNPLLRVNSGTGRSVVLVITSNRGLCGGYNANLLRTGVAFLRTQEESGESDEEAARTVELQVAGKKGISYFRFMRRPMAATYTQFEDKPQFVEIEPIADDFIRRYANREIDSVHVIYMRFESTARQYPETLPLLPMKPPAPRKAKEREGEPRTTAAVRYDFTPPAEELLAELLPLTVKTRLFQCFIDAAVSEQVARMVAMKAATDSAGDMLKQLNQAYNRARQTQITLELLDIVGGAEALK